MFAPINAWDFSGSSSPVSQPQGDFSVGRGLRGGQTANTGHPEFGGSPIGMPAPQPQATDPYLGQVTQGVAQATADAGQALSQSQSLLAGINQGNQAISQMQQGSSSPAAAYPSYPNAAGAGSQQAGNGTQNSSGQMDMPVNPATGSNYGLSPWSLIGEAMTRR